jgi:hypothetical protein
MASATLTPHDLFILEKIKDPESAPSASLLIDDSLPKDPNITESAVYEAVSSLERAIILSIQQVELQLGGQSPASSNSALSQYLTCVSRLNKLIEDYPKYASARNNRAQALRRIYGDGILIKSEETSRDTARLSDSSSSDSTLQKAANTILQDLTTAVDLLTPVTPFSPISPQTAKTLSQAFTQRGALYHLTAKQLSNQKSQLRIEGSMRESGWSAIDFEENASRDFMMGGRFGNEIAKALVVSTNPVAKL